MTQVRFTVLVSFELAEALRALAEAGNRPLSREIREALEDHVDESYRDVA